MISILLCVSNIFRDLFIQEADGRQPGAGCAQHCLPDFPVELAGPNNLFGLT